MDKNFIISERYLSELGKIHSNALVGKSCKRFEISNNISDIKANVRELIYEEFRAFLDNIKAYNLGGKEITVYKFNKGGE